MSEINFVNPKAVLFADVMKKIFLPTGSKPIKFKNLNKEIYGPHNNKTKNYKIMMK